MASEPIGKAQSKGARRKPIAAALSTQPLTVDGTNRCRACASFFISSPLIKTLSEVVPCIMFCGIVFPMIRLNDLKMYWREARFTCRNLLVSSLIILHQLATMNTWLAWHNGGRDRFWRNVRAVLRHPLFVTMVGILLAGALALIGL